jgi:hypothetical protein
MGNELQRLFVVIGLKNDLSPALQKASVDLKKLGAIVTGVGVAITASLVGMTTSWATAGDEIEKLAEKTGFSTEALSELKYAAQLSGSSLSELETGIKRMQYAIVQAGYGLESYTRVFQELGLSYDQLKDLAPEDQFTAITDAIADMPDPTEKAAVALELFGRAGTDLLPMLSSGSAGLDAMKQEAHDLGLVFTSEAAKKAEAFKDSITKLKGAVSGLFSNIAEALAPVLTKLVGFFSSIIQKITDWLHKHPALTDALTKFAFAIGLAATAIGTIILVQQTWLKLLPLLRAAFVATTGPIGLLTFAIGGLIAGIVLLVDHLRGSASKALEEFKGNVQDLGDSILNDLSSAISDLRANLNQTTADIVKDTKTQQDAIDNLISYIQGIQNQGIELIPEDMLGQIGEINPVLGAQLQGLNDQIKGVRNQYDQLDEALSEKRIAEIKIELGRPGETKQQILDLLNELAGLYAKEAQNLIKENAPDLLASLNEQQTALDNGLATQLASWENYFQNIKDGWDGSLNYLQNTIIPAMNKALAEGLITSDTANQIEQAYQNILNQAGQLTPAYTEKTPWTQQITPARPPLSSINLQDLLNIPGRATGGIEMYPAIRRVAETGPEALIPLSRFSQLGSAANNETHIHNHFGAFICDDVSLRKFGRMLDQVLKENDRRNSFHSLQKGYGYGTSSI